MRKAQCIDAVYKLDSLLVTKVLSEVMAPIQAFERLKPGAALPDGSYLSNFEAVPLRTISLQKRIESNLPQALLITGDQGIKLQDVKSHKATLTSFVAQLNESELATMVRGEGMCSPKVAPGTAAAFGGISQRLFYYGIPAVACTDGPSGIRMDSGHKASQVAIGTLLSCTWNRELNEQLFYLVGQELRSYQIDNLLGPGINIHRHPLNGRNFEYFSEDPLLTGAMAVAQTIGLKRAGVSATIKHFAANDQETNRHNVDSVVSQRALREIHLKGFERAVTLGCVSSIMTCYNPINGHWGASNYDLNTTVLRNEWEYSGIVMSDWWAKMNDPIAGGKANKQFTSYMLRAQNDLYMVVDNDGAERNTMQDNTLRALQKGQLTLGELQRAVINICGFIMNTPAMNRPLKPFDPISSFQPLHSVANSQWKGIDQDIEFYSESNKSVMIKLNHSGVYQLSAVVSYNCHSLAQSSTSVSLNGLFCMSLAVNGTEGESVVIEGQKIRMDKGFYLLEVNVIKPGMKVEILRFIKA